MKQDNANLIKGFYKGLHLPGSLGYYPKHLQKANSTFSIAWQNQHKVYSFTLYGDTDFQPFQGDIGAKDESAKYLWKLVDSQYQLMIFTHIDDEGVFKFINKLNPHFSFVKKIDDIEADAVNVALMTYSLAEFNKAPKTNKKSKRFDGSGLSEEEKQQSLEFSITPKIIRPS